MRGMAVPTMVWSSAASNSPNISPPTVSTRSRRGRAWKLGEATATAWGAAIGAGVDD